MRKLSLTLATVFALSASAASAQAPRADLEQALKAAPAGSWEAALLEELIELYARDPGVAQPLDELRGLNPDFYLRQRRPEPEVGRELGALTRGGQLPAAVLIERAWRGLDQMRFSDGRAGVEERAQLRDALYRAIGESGHALADDYLAHAARTDDARGRAVALGALGWTRTPLAVDTLREAVRGDDPVSAIVGLGAAQQAEILVELSRDKSLTRAVDHRRALASALAMHPGSREAAVALVDLLVVEADAGVVMNLVEALTRVAHADTRALLANRSFASDAAERGAASVVRRIERRRARGR